MNRFGKRDLPRIELTVGEISGALGDSITVLPIVVAIGALSDASLGTVLLGFGLFQVVWGLYYGVPVSVEPMKALAALLIVGGLSLREYAFAGLLAGFVLLLVGRGRALGRVRAYIDEPVVRGVQLAVALLLLETGVRLGWGDPPLALLTAGIVAALLLVGIRRTAPLVVLAIGAGWAAFAVGPPALAVPALSVWTAADAPVQLLPLVGATVGQLAMTVGNAAVATSLLLSDYYDADVTPDELATSMGLMNLVAVPLGMLPMCHGSGGLAGKYTFGARTVGSNLVLGAVYTVAALFATGLVMAFPLALLGVVLLLVALELARTSLDTDGLGVTLLVGLVSLFSNVGVGFAVGLVGSLLLRRVPSPGDDRSVSIP